VALHKKRKKVLE